MDYRLLFTQKSLEDLDEIVSWIAEDDPDAAARFGMSLLDHVELLSRFPRLGAVIPARRQVRKLLHSPVVVYYLVHESRRMIEILHFRHGARKVTKL